MSAFKKVAITIPMPTYRAVEATRKRLKQTRSAVVAAALEQWIEHLEMSEADRRYARGYVEHPEAEAEQRETEAMATAALAGWSAWAPGAPSRASEARPRMRRRR